MQRAPDVGSVDEVVLVDRSDRPVGFASKLEAHRPPGLLHRAVSACLFDRSGRVLVQRRALGKYHFPGIWSNTCCTHPRAGESPLDAVARRLDEELGVRGTELEPVGTFVYRAEDPDSGLVEHELDHVVVGLADGEPVPAPDEVMEVAFVEPGELLRPRAASGARELTPWFGDVLRLALAGPDRPFRRLAG